MYKDRKKKNKQKVKASQNYTDAAQNDHRSKMNQRLQKRSSLTFRTLEQSFVTFFPNAPH